MFYKSEKEIMKDWDSTILSPILTVVCITYNHEKYIEEALDSMLIQETNFPFEIIVGEDCSPDQTKDILVKYQKRYPNIVKPILRKENVGAYKNEEECILLSKGKYIAFLEGDDFWVDKLKLQKQVDFLNNNLEYGLVHGDVNHLYEETGKIIQSYNKINNLTIPNGNIYDFLLKPSHSIKTMTVCLRKELLISKYLDNPKIKKQKWKLIDISLWLMISKYSKVYYMNDVLSTYRCLSESSSRTQDSYKLYQFHTQIYSIRFFFLRSFGSSIQTRNILYQSYYKSLFYDGYNLKNIPMMYRGKIGLKFFNKNLTFKEKIYFFIAFFKIKLLGVSK